MNLAEPMDETAAIKKRDVTWYHLPSGEYGLATGAHRTDMLNYEPRKQFHV